MILSFIQTYRKDWSLESKQAKRPIHMNEQVFYALSLLSTRSPGFGLTLVAESTTGVLLSAEGVGAAGMLPEDLSRSVSNQLLLKIKEGGNVDPCVQWLYLLLMTLASEDVSSILFSELTPYTIQFLRDLKLFLGVQFKLQSMTETSMTEASMTETSTTAMKTPLKTVLVSGLGMGYVNYSLRST